jgi:cation diffusion facilitator CzcD-associated flavoprotein CzcO
MAAAKKSICIVGAGPAGLVAAKTFLRTGLCDVTVYEKADRLGGIWALDESSVGNYLSPQTPTNLSKFTVGFSDLSWDSVGLNQDQNSAGAPLFPKAWQVNTYLEAYRKRFIPDDVIKYKHEVADVHRRLQLAKGAKESWVVKVKDQHGLEEEKVFDHLIVASGFFSTPRPLQQTVSADDEKLAIKAIHSSRFRDLEDLFPESTPAAGKTILIIGGGNSSGEVAAAVASNLSDTQWSPDRAQQKRFEGCKIVHVTPRPLYGLPPFVSTDDTSSAFVPVDFHLYNLSRRLPGPITGNAGQVTDEVKNMIHGAMRSMLGGDQSDLGAEALVTSEGGERNSPGGTQ